MSFELRFVYKTTGTPCAMNYNVCLSGVDTGSSSSSLGGVAEHSMLVGVVEAPSLRFALYLLRYWHRACNVLYIHNVRCRILCCCSILLVLKPRCLCWK